MDNTDNSTDHTTPTPTMDDPTPPPPSTDNSSTDIKTPVNSTDIIVDVDEPTDDSSNSQQSQPEQDKPSPPSFPTFPTSKPEEPLIDLPKPKLALEEIADDGAPAISIKTDTTPKSEPKPASLPDQPIVGDYVRSKNKPLIIGFTSVILLVITAGLAFLYVQNNRLKGQIRTIEDINSQRNLPPLTPTATPSGTPELVTQTVFSSIDNVITTAQSESATAQLLMITADNLTLDGNSQTTYNYWFRTGPGTTEYFQVTKAVSAEDHEIVKPATVNPDNNIPDLIESKNTNTLGIDDQQVIKLGWEKVGNQFSQGNKPESISLIYIKANPSNPNITTPINLWQVTYLFPQESGVEDIIIQVNANTQDVVFTNKNITVPTNEPTPTPTETPTSSAS